MTGGRRSAPAALRNREPIAQVLEGWLPETGLVLEIASGTGEHAAFLARRFPQLEWQPSDRDKEELDSIRAWREESGLLNLREPLVIDASARTWPVTSADALLNINMVHISPPAAAIGLLDGASRILAPGAPLILYGPWLSDEIETAPSNIEFDLQLRARDPQWGLRTIEDFAADASRRGFALKDRQAMPANNLMLLFRKKAGNGLK